jgi:hypothetical protein
MRGDEFEERLMARLAGLLSWHEEADLDREMADDAELQERWELLQKVQEMDAFGIMQVKPRASCKRVLLESLRSGKGARGQRFGFPIGFWNTAVACVLIGLLGIGVMVLQKRSGLDESGSNRPVLAVFTIPADASMEQGYRANIANLVFSAESQHLDSLGRAERHVQQMWLASDGVQEPSGTGFVVLDLEGHQGFVAIRREVFSNPNSLPLLFCLSEVGHEGDRSSRISIGTASEPGVFYFRIPDSVEFVTEDCELEVSWAGTGTVDREI